MRASPAGPRSLPGLRNHFFNGITGLTSSFRPLPYNFRARVQPLLFTLLADLNGVPCPCSISNSRRRFRTLRWWSGPGLEAIPDHSRVGRYRGVSALKPCLGCFSTRTWLIINQGMVDLHGLETACPGDPCDLSSSGETFSLRVRVHRERRKGQRLLVGAPCLPTTQPTGEQP